MDIIPMLDWRQPLWLLLLVVPALYLLLSWISSRQQAEQYAEKQLLPWAACQASGKLLQKLFSRTTAWFLLWVLLAISAAGPRLALNESSDIRETVDIGVVLDMSASMNVTDIHPDRFRRARIEINEWLSMLRGDRVSLIVFSGKAHALLPLTADRNVFRHYLNSLNPAVMPTAGSNITSALATARQQLQASRSRSRAVLLVTDGDFRPEEITVLDTLLAKLKADNIPVFVLATGTLDGGNIASEGGLWLRVNGNIVTSGLKPGLLKKIASVTGGRYHVVSDSNTEWQALYHNGIARLASYNIAADRQGQVRWHELYPWALLPAILLFLYLVRNQLFTRGTVLPVLFVIVSALPQHADAATAEQRAYQAYQQEQYKKAALLYEQVKGYRGLMGQAASRYMRGEYKLAAQYFATAIVAARTDHERAIAVYNLGNTFFKLRYYQLARDSYRDALRYLPGLKKARKNLDFTLLLIKEINKQLAVVNANRRGRRGSLQPGQDNGGQGSYGLDERKRKQPGASKRGKTRSRLDALVEQGVRDAILASSGKKTGSKGKLQRLDAMTMLAIRSRMNLLDDRHSLLIKNLLEFDAGYNAPLEKPEPLPGVAPW